MTDKQKRFAAEYLVDLNATKAAIRAGYSEKTAYSIGNENLKKPEIKKYIEERQLKNQSKIDIHVEDILEALKTIGFADIENEKIKASDKIRALEIISKMLGYNDNLTPDICKLDEVLNKITGNI